MTLVINGQQRFLDVVTLGDVFKALGLRLDQYIVERNGDVCSRPFSDVTLFDGDVLEIVQFVGGGSLVGPMRNFF